MLPTMSKSTLTWSSRMRGQSARAAAAAAEDVGADEADDDKDSAGEKDTTGDVG